MRTVVVTADDFGADDAVNEAVERGHRGGILTAASLMAAGPAAADAVARARHMPDLGVGLHLVLVEGRPVLPPERLPDLVGSDGCFRTDLARLGADIFLRPTVRRQVAAEIEAQFAAFAATGLPIDHVNAHKHFHVHPTIAALVARIGPHYGMRAVRAPVEPGAMLDRIEPAAADPLARIAGFWARRLRGRLRRAGLTVPDQVFGLRWSGAMSPARLRALLDKLPAGLSEIYLHPATVDAYPGSAPGYRYRDELAALLDPQAGALARRGGVRLARFADLAAA